MSNSARVSSKSEAKQQRLLKLISEYGEAKYREGLFDSWIFGPKLYGFMKTLKTSFTRWVKDGPFDRARGLRGDEESSNDRMWNRIGCELKELGFNRPDDDE